MGQANLKQFMKFADIFSMSTTSITSAVSSASSTWLAAAKKSLSQNTANIVSALPVATNAALGLDLMQSIYDNKAISQSTLKSYMKLTATASTSSTTAATTADSTAATTATSPSSKTTNAALGTILDYHA